jgi:tRNA1Val (adenine37-N6)-methyltransferase
MPFDFKNFSITDSNSALKVGVDAVLLASWINFNNVNSVLDVGCGCGILTIAAGKKIPKGTIYGLDIDKGAIDDTQINIENNQLTTNCNAVYTNFLTWKAPLNFDIIICNPPYFKGLNIQMNEQKQKARFEKFLPLHDFFKHCNTLCEGKIYMVYPFEFLPELITKANDNQWFANEILHIKGNPQSNFKRALIQFSKIKSLTNSINELTIETDRGVYTEEYQALTKEYYLKF